MTIAVCLRCGVRKSELWGPCPECGFEAWTGSQRNQALSLSDHSRGRVELEDIGERIASGELKVLTDQEIEMAEARAAAPPQKFGFLGAAVFVAVAMTLTILLLRWWFAGSA